MLQTHRLLAAYETARDQLLARRTPDGHWVGELSSSALSTATAVSTLALLRRESPRGAAGQATGGQLDRLVDGGVRWLAGCQNPDGGWGDTDKSLSNVATTLLVRAALELAGAAEAHARHVARAEAYVAGLGGLEALRRRYGKDKTFAVPILTNCAIAGLVSWQEVSPLPFELACLPQSWFRFARLPVVSYAIPALVAIGQARFYHWPPRNPALRWLRRRAQSKSLAVLDQMQPASGGFLEATPLTSFVVMSLISIGKAEHPVARRGLEFILASVRPDGSWPIDSNLATWVTSLSLMALEAEAGQDRGFFEEPLTPPSPTRGEGDNRLTLLSPAWGEGKGCPVDLDWLLSCQHRQVHPYTGAAPGGWGWSDLSGAVPDADDTPAALLALAAWRPHQQVTANATAKLEQIHAAARMGQDWLLGLQNGDGGWPTFCRGWGNLPFDRSGADLTAHALRALAVWQTIASQQPEPLDCAPPSAKVQVAIRRGFEFLSRRQQADGSWIPLWFGDQFHPGEENPIYGTARVLLAYRDLERLADPAARRGLAWLVVQQNQDGGWGHASRSAGEAAGSSVEETALAVEALLPACGALAGEGQANLSAEPFFTSSPRLQAALCQGLNWLSEAVQSGRYQESAPIGFYFAKLWYHEALYPLIFTVSALGQAARRLRSAHSLQPPARTPTETVA